MKYLLDTHPFLLWISNSARLPSRVAEVVRNPQNSIYLSISSVRAMQIKSQIGRLDLPLPVVDIVKRQNQENGIEILPISLAHITGLNGIPNYHGDPFDYLLISQAMTENLTILTKDPLLTQYPVKVFW
jgi:PIN domain nuclease of toxin-antitoxin system